MTKTVRASIGVAAATGAALGIALIAQMHAPHNMAEPKYIELPAEGLSLPMQDFGGRPVVEVYVNEKGPYRFILDTGANINVASVELDRELAFRRSTVSAKSTNGPVPQIVIIDKLRVGGAVLGEMLAAVMPLSNLINGTDAPKGVLSAASFPGCLLTYDYPARRIVIRKGELPAAGANGIFNYPSGRPLPSMQVRVAGVEAQVLLDTGGGAGLTLPTFYLKKIPLASEPKETKAVRLIGRDFPATIARVDGPIEVGGYKLDLAEVRFSDEQPTADSPIGSIGYEVLRHFVVTIDSKNQRVKLSR